MNKKQKTKQVKTKNKKMLFYDNFAADFDSVVNMYDTNKRLEVIYDELLANDNLKNKKLLDAGCGTGWFSAAAVKRGAKVTSLDVGEKLLKEVAKKCKSKRVVGSILDLTFKNNTFDYIVSSEVIEHTPNPNKALKEFYRVLKPSGILVLTTPNSFWYLPMRVAHWIGVRPYQGLENWHWYGELKTKLKDHGFKVKEMYGIHAFPFIPHFLNPVLDLLHSFRKILAPTMVNIAVKCQKPKK